VQSFFKALGKRQGQAGTGYSLLEDTIDPDSDAIGGAETADALEEVLQETLRMVKDLHPRGWVPLDVLNIFREEGSSRTATASRMGRSLGYVDANLNRYRALAKAVLRMKGRTDRWYEGEEWESINHIIAGYRSLMHVVGYRGTVEILRLHADKAWARSSGTRQSLHRAVIWSGALAKWLQQCGHFREAKQALLPLKTLGAWNNVQSLVDSDTADAIMAVVLRMNQRDFGTVEGERDLEQAKDQLKNKENFTKFYWRTGLNAVAFGRIQSLGSILNTYEDMTGGARIASANINLVNSFAALHQRQFDEAMESAKNYRRKQQMVWSKFTEIPDPAIQGVLTGLYLEAMVCSSAPFCRPDKREELGHFLESLSRIQHQVDVGPLADGLREIAIMRKIILPGWQFSAREERTGKIKIRKGRKRDLSELCNQLDRLISS
jgi:hypothetical protein